MIKNINGTLSNVTRLASSANGNPRYECTIDGVTVRTAPDASLGYAITNYKDRTVMATVRMYYGNLTLVDIREVTR